MADTLKPSITNPKTSIEADEASLTTEIKIGTAAAKTQTSVDTSGKMSVQENLDTQNSAKAGIDVSVSIFGFVIVYAVVLFIFNMSNFSQVAGSVLSNFFGVFLGSFSTGALWTHFQKKALPNSEKMKLIAGCLFSAVFLDFFRVSILASITYSLALLPILLISHIAVGGFVILSGLHIGNWLVLKQQSNTALNHPE